MPDNPRANSGRRIYRVSEVLEKRGGSRTKLWRDVRDGKFPAPVQLGPNSIGWYSDEVDEDIDSLPRVHYAPEGGATE